MTAPSTPDRSWAPATFPDYEPTVPNLLADGVARFGARECVVTPEERLTYRQLDERSRLLAARLVRSGVGKASRVGVLFPNSADWVIAWAAAARIGAVTIPVNTFYKPAELRPFLRHADVQCLVGVGSFIQHDYLERLETIAPELVGAAPPLLLASLPQLRRVLLWGDSDRSWVEGGVGRDGDEPDPELLAVVAGMESDVSPGDDLFVTYTSGSTGEPKGVVHSHGGVIRHARNLAALSATDETSRLWTPMPLCWIGGFAFTLLRGLTVGACFLTQEVFEPAAALRMMEDEQVTNVSAWPGIAKTLTEHPDFARTDLSAVRAGSFYDALPADRRPPDQGLTVTSLGMSESCGPHTFWLPSEEVTGSPEEYRGSFGHEVPGTQHRIIDPDTGLDLPDGQEGEVLVRGYSLMKGMYKRERSEVFDADGWYHTGDRGLFRDGWFFFTGRQSDLIKTRGSNVAPAEVEKVLLSLEGIKLAYVLGVPHPDDGEQVVAMVVPWADAPPAVRDPEWVRDRLREELSSYKVPRHVFLLGDADVPWLVSQKVDRRALLDTAQKLVSAT
ncbi:MAG TPA: class I adenylate-forming enzyme family protein [Acidimicrobiales bacterium]|nr:class I adenylate-forming enzyme family protein [Acidimicrobiales bacterium]